MSGFSIVYPKLPRWVRTFPPLLTLSHILLTILTLLTLLTTHVNTVNTLQREHGPKPQWTFDSQASIEATKANKYCPIPLRIPWSLKNPKVTVSQSMDNRHFIKDVVEDWTLQPKSPSFSTDKTLVGHFTWYYCSLSHF